MSGSNFNIRWAWLLQRSCASWNRKPCSEPPAEQTQLSLSKCDQVGSYEVWSLSESLQSTWNTLQLFHKGPVPGTFKQIFHQAVYTKENIFFTNISNKPPTEHWLGQSPQWNTVLTRPGAARCLADRRDFQGTKWNVNFQYPLVVWNTLWLFSTKMLSRMIGMIRWVWIDCWNLSFFFKMSSLDATGSATEPQRMGIRSWVMGLLLPWSGWPSHVKNMSSKLLKWLPPVLSDTENWLELGRLRWDVDIMSLKQNCQVYWIPIWYVSEEMFEWDPYDKKNTITWKLMGDLIQTKFQQVLKLVCIPGTKRKSQLRCDITPRISWATHFHHHHVLPKYTGPCTLTVD